MNIIGITGMTGAGKGTVVDYLVNHKGYTHLSVRSVLEEEIVKRGIPMARESMYLVANDLRSKHSASYIVEELYRKAVALGKDCIIESVRTIGEVEGLKKMGHFYLFGVDADVQLRYERVHARGGAIDHITFEEFMREEIKESTSTDPSRNNLRGCIELAHVVLHNNGTKEELYEAIEKAFDSLKEAKLS